LVSFKGPYCVRTGQGEKINQKSHGDGYQQGEDKGDQA